jgi:hypothetical protein
MQARNALLRGAGDQWWRRAGATLTGSGTGRPEMCKRMFRSRLRAVEGSEQLMRVGIGSFIAMESV